MSFPVENRGAPRPLAQQRAAREALALRLRSGTIRTPPLPVHLTPVIVKQRVEVKTKFVEIIGVVTRIGDGFVELAHPVAWDPRGFWTHGRPMRAVLGTQIERLTVLEGPIPVPLEDRGFLEPTEVISGRATNYVLKGRGR